MLLVGPPKPDRSKGRSQTNKVNLGSTIGKYY